MDFTDTVFWFSLLPAFLLLCIGHFILKGHARAKHLFNKLLIAALSISLLGYASWQSLIIFLCVTNLAYFACRAKVCCAARLSWSEGKFRWVSRALLAFLIPMLFAPLAYYKYGHFFTSSILQTEWDTFKDLIIPIGISFYSFQTVGFCIDTLMGDKEMPSWLDYINFCAYFPAIVAGPIERRADLLPQVERMALSPSSAQFNEGVRYILLGLFFKMSMADKLADAFFVSYAGTSAWLVWFNNLLFTFRIYFDFAGYGLTAYGVAQCMGITLRMNFLAPYTAANISEFWRRWHTSLTLWFRDYIYFPLGGSRTTRWALNLVIVFLVSGLWHGAGWNFIMWGGFAGVFMVIHRLFNKAGFRLWAPLGWLITFSLMVFVWMFFYDTKQDMLLHHLQLIFTPDAYQLEEVKKALHLPATRSSFAWGLIYIALSFIIVLLEYLSRRWKDMPYALLLSPISCGVMVYIMIVTHSDTPNQFIYFNF